MWPVVSFYVMDCPIIQYTLASHYLCSTCIAGCLVLAILPKLSAQHVLPTCRFTYLHRPQDNEVLKASYHLMAAGPNPDTAQAMAANDHPASNTSSGSPRADECPMAQQCSAAAVAAAGAGHTEHLNTEVTGPATPTHSSLASPVLSPVSSPDASRRSSVNVEMLFANVDAEQQLQVGTLLITMVGSTPLAADT